MTITRPAWTSGLVQNDRLQKPLTDLLDALIRAANADSGVSDVAARVSLLEALRINGTNGITVTGSIESGFRVSFTGSASDVLAAQIFGG